jgi:transcriptional regulator with XRE-family HTH domain
MPIIAILPGNNTIYSGFINTFRPAMLRIMKRTKEGSEVLLGRRIRKIRKLKGWTQQELGNRADVNYKFIGEIERGQQNPSFNILVKIASALEVELPELFRFKHEILNRKEIENRIKNILPTIPDEELSRILLLLNVLYPTR